MKKRVYFSDGPHDRWWHMYEAKYVICVPPKNGGSTIKYCKLARRGRYSAATIQRYFPKFPKYLALRHPVERFVSLWRSKCRDDGDVKEIQGLSPRELMSHIHKYPEANPHWLSQASYVIPGNILIDYARLFRMFDLLPCDAVNSTVEQENDPLMPTRTIMTHYAEDLALWLTLK